MTAALPASQFLIYQTEDGQTKITEGALQPETTDKNYLAVKFEGNRQIKRQGAKF